MPDALSGAALPRVLAIADRRGWAIDHKAGNLQRVLAGRFDIQRVYQDEVGEAEVEAADLVLLFYWLELRKLKLPESALAARRDRLLIGICSHFELEGALRDEGLGHLNRLPCAVFANNLALQREFAPLIGVPVHYTPNGVDTGLFRPAPERPRREPGSLRVGWAGSLDNMGAAHRGFTDVIEPAVAAVAGASLALARREERWRPQAEMPAFYAGLDAYVCASRSEGTPNTCLEAAACGIPLVTTRVGNMPELVQDEVNGLFFDGSAAHLAQQLCRLRDEPLLAQRLSTRMLETIRDWDWRHQAEHYARLFDSVL